MVGYSLEGFTVVLVLLVAVVAVVDVAGRSCMV
jgi:hypothetical protein